MKILVINCGSTTLKYQLIDSETEKVYAKGLCERIGIADADIAYTSSTTGEKKEKKIDMPDHSVAFQAVIDVLLDPVDGAVKSLDEIDAVGHRVVHGGEFFDSSVIINDEVIAKIKECSDLAPLHNPANLLGIDACSKLMPGTPQCAVFDTAFHQTMPEEAYIYGIPFSYYEKYKIRRYGFHGTSHSFVSKRAIEILGKPVEDSKVIVCHLGGGASITAVKGGKSVDTSMGFTPLDGLIMGTRCGSLDPGVVTYIMKKYNLTADQMETILTKKSGFVGVSGVSSDCRDLEEAAARGEKRAQLALEIFRYGLLKFVGAFSAAMGGVDLIVFTGGIGENDPKTRAYIGQKCAYLGVDFDEEVNAGLRGKSAILTKKDSKVKVAVVCTNEELVIATDTMKLVKM